MNRIKEILEKVYHVPKLRASYVPLFLGNPGLGKTKMIEQFADSKGVRLVEFITSQRNPFEISGMAMPDQQTKKMSIWDFDTLLEMNDGDILFFDEVLNGNPTVLNACLTLLEQRRMISGKKLPDIMIIAAANPQGMAPLTPQIKERFVWHEVKFSPSLFKAYMQDKYYMPENISTALCKLIMEEDFSGINYITPRSVEKALLADLHTVPQPEAYKKLTNIFNYYVKNPLENGVTLGTSGRILEKDEMISWLELLKYKFKLKI